MQNETIYKIVWRYKFEFYFHLRCISHRQSPITKVIQVDCEKLSPVIKLRFYTLPCARFEYASVIRTYWIWKYYDNWRDYYEMSEKCYYATQFRFLLIGLDFTFLHNLQIIRYMMDQKNTFGKYKRTHLHNPLVKPNK